MTWAKPHSILRLLFAVSAVFLLTFSAFGEDDPNPDSPIPVLISQNNSIRTLANLKGDAVPNIKSGINSIKNFRAEPEIPFEYNSKIVIYLTNIKLLSDENADAFRVYIEDQAGRKYRFPVSQIEPVKDFEWVYALTIDLRDDIGFWKQQPENGDVLLRVSWRGLTTNQTLLGIGKTGGTIELDKDSKPTPFPLQPTEIELPPSLDEAPTEDAVGYRYSGDRLRFMEQATFGPNVMTDQRIRRLGLRVWLGEQFDAPYPDANYPYPNMPQINPNTDVGCPLPTTDPLDAICLRDNYSMYLPQKWFYQQALYGNAQLRHRVAWALSQIWVVSDISDIDTQAIWMFTYHQQLSKNAFGNYRTLMKDVTLNPLMGNYLDMIRSSRTNPNENFAREILQLFSIGLFMLNDNGTLKLDANNNPIPTYEQAEVNNFSRVFTGWRTCENTALCPNRTEGVPNYKDPMIVTASVTDTANTKTLLAYTGAPNPTIPACTNCTTDANRITYANESLDKALDNIFYHPNVPPFISKQLIQHLVMSNPSPAYVGRISAVFKNNGVGVRGDLKAVVRAILLDPEARGNVKTDPNYGKLREPVQYITNVLRQFNVRSADGTQLSDGIVNDQASNIGQDVFRAPTVFNYYAPTYVIAGTSLSGPEFNLLTTGTSVARMNRMNTLVFGTLAVAQPNRPLGTSIDLSEMVALSQSDATGNRLVDTLNTKLLGGRMPTAMKNSILTAVTAVAATDPTLRARTAIYLVTTSSQYQIQR